MAVAKNPIVRSIFLVLGWIWVAIGFVGLVLPGLPTTGPILLAAYFFSRSSERFDTWLVTNRYFGMIVRDWRAGRGFSVRGKVIAVSAIVLSFGVSTAFFITGPFGRVVMWGLAAAIATYVVTRPTKRDDTAVEHATA